MAVTSQNNNNCSNSADAPENNNIFENNSSTSETNGTQSEPWLSSISQVTDLAIKGENSSPQEETNNSVFPEGAFDRTRLNLIDLSPA